MPPNNFDSNLFREFLLLTLTRENGVTVSTTFDGIDAGVVDVVVVDDNDDEVVTTVGRVRLTKLNGRGLDTMPRNGFDVIDGDIDRDGGAIDDEILFCVF